jgi:hypothetical protein
MRKSAIQQSTSSSCTTLSNDRAGIPPRNISPKKPSSNSGPGCMVRDWLAAAAGSKPMHAPSDAGIDSDNSALVRANELIWL